MDFQALRAGRAMRIHIQNEAVATGFEISTDHWRAAVARGGAIAAGHEVSFGATAATLEAGLLEAELLITSVAALAGQLPLPSAPRLRAIFCTSAGLDRLAPFTWLPPGVALLNNAGTHSAKAGEYALMALLMLANRLPALMTAQRAGRWEPLHGSVLAGRQVTIVGLGGLGGAAAEHAARLGMRVTGVRARPAPHPACARVVASADLDALLPQSEFLLLACPLTHATRGLMDRRRLGLLPRGGGVINIGRGALLDQAALGDLLEAGQLAGAVLDVFAEEPIPPGDRLWTLPNLIITPHVSCDDPNSYIPESLDIFFANLRAIAAGARPPNQIDPERGY